MNSFAQGMEKAIQQNKDITKYLTPEFLPHLNTFCIDKVC